MCLNIFALPCESIGLDNIWAGSSVSYWKSWLWQEWQKKQIWHQLSRLKGGHQWVSILWVKQITSIDPDAKSLHPPFAKYWTNLVQFCCKSSTWWVEEAESLIWALKSLPYPLLEAWVEPRRTLVLQSFKTLKSLATTVKSSSEQ